MKVIKRIPKYLSIEEVELLLDRPYLEGIKAKEELKERKNNKSHWLRYARNRLFSAKRDYAILNLFYSSGIRLRELVNLDLKDIDFKQDRDPDNQNEYSKEYRKIWNRSRDH